jgi:hypothetical protein
MLRPIKCKKLAIPKIECGLDKLDWQQVSTLIDKTFKNARTKLTVYFRHTVSDLLTQNIVYSIHMINKIEQRNIGDTNDIMYVNLRCKSGSEPSRCVIDSFINEYPVETLIDTGADSCYIEHSLCRSLNLQIQPY